MKKRVLSLFLVVTMCIVALPFCKKEVRAAEAISEDVPLSVIMTENALIGESEFDIRGVYYLSGKSIINDAGGGKIGWGGCTYAAVRCKVSVNAMVERLVNGSWVHVTSSSTTVENAYTAVVSKTSLVASGYSYRVRCYHYAHTDYSDSCTSALRM